MKKWADLSKEQQKEVNHQLEVIRRGVVEIVPEDQLKQKIINSVIDQKPLKIKFGMDPSSPDIHIGHSVALHKLRQFQELGHHIQLLIGDFTGMIGDPTGKSETRKKLTKEDVQQNAKTYQKQIYKILDPNRTEVVYNADWLAPLKFSDIIELTAKLTVARMLERDDFSKRYASGQPISIYEFLYPLMQGYDSVILESDIELGGTDQKFNLLMGRTLQKEYNVPTQAIITMPLLEGLDGIQKMSKSLGNYIGINEEPNDIYGKAMSIPDELMLKYYQLATDISDDELNALKSGLTDGTIHPRDAKMKLSYTFVRMFNGEEDANAAQLHFQTVFQQGALPEEIPDVQLTAAEVTNGSIRLVKLLVIIGLQSSNAEAKRSIVQGAVKINEEKMEDPNAEIKVFEGDIVQIGRRKFGKITII